ncbi:MAG: phosphoenolpyruvate--protein phosphotransferase [Candidatus Eisenbacteria bacterium]|uniref:Phosphoenolpyruvate-protein phosphotransferase n=1 Tax=Eiseniibacteriota bacterium TaxID=2212470 RepID=A0A948RUB4_UNCEI|nr:phosphoenolpyruvate--protein phosphotransferase [Candidatus Eisenbacteria bacterium]MBU1950124.1 phosphoenolpyruvate--protein phosphotransferase [Candidatus Eisenbacteria bacterium]MBU2689834.1 phosphoenolpyruvate--protein phosphotransferase [Candidatus Eisenbacteria bacterium]
MPRKAEPKPPTEHMIGVPAAPGFVAGPVYLLDGPSRIIVKERSLEPHEIAGEVRHFRKALRLAREEITAICNGIESPEDAGLQLLNAHGLIVEDHTLQGRIIDTIKNERIAADGAVYRIFMEYITHMEGTPGEYFRARGEDMRDVMHRILQQLQDWELGSAAAIPQGVILVASELSPSESACLDPQRILGVATDHGGATNHVAIMARNRGIPAVLGLVNITTRVQAGDMILLDGSHGRVTLRPARSELKAFQRLQTRELRIRTALGQQVRLPSHTIDLQRIPLFSNIEAPDDAELALKEGAEGIGLYRTEFLYSRHTGWPSEEEQVRAYRRVVRKMRKRPVIIRTMDVGGDKFAALSGIGRESNPFLGVRGIRFSLMHPEIFRTQLRAIMRVADQGNVRILLPMVSNLDEVREAKQLVGSVRREVEREGVAVQSLALGVMVEVPSMVILSDLLSREVDFLSIGSNDLIQYVLAADRGNENVAHIYDPFHPAVLRAIYTTVQSGHRAGISVSSCGEMSGDPMGVLVLLGLGIDQLSVAPWRIKPVKQIIRASSISHLRHVIEQDALTCATPSELRTALIQAFPDTAAATWGKPNGLYDPSPQK